MTVQCTNATSDIFNYLDKEAYSNDMQIYFLNTRISLIRLIEAWGRKLE